MLPFLVLIPILLLLLAALAILLLQQSRPSIGYAWLTGMLAGMAVIALLMVSRSQLPLDLVIEQMSPFPSFSSPPAFRMDINSWPYAFSLAVLALAFLMTDSARLETEARPVNWAAGLVLVSLAMLAVLAANPVTLIFSWTAVDLAEFLMLMGTSAGRKVSQQTIIAFSVRVAGTLLVVLAVLFARSRDIAFDFSPIPAPLAVFLLMAVGLRLGVLPLNLPYYREAYPWRGLGNVLRMIGPASSLVVLGRMPEQFVPPEWQGVFLGLSALAAAYSGGMWLVSNNELNARPYWLAALASLSVASAVNGSSQASIAWGTALILTGSVIFFFSARRKQILFIPLFAVIGIIGLPFTPASAGWQGLVGHGHPFYILLFLVSIPMLIWGFLLHIFRPRDELYRMERWVHTIYPTGLVVLILGHWIVSTWGVTGTFRLGPWWASAVAALITGAGIAAWFAFRGVLNSGELRDRWVVVFARRVGSLISAVFRLNWFYRLLAGIYGLVQNLIQLLTAIFEGDGGILWSFVMLALLISLIWTGSLR